MKIPFEIVVVDSMPADMFAMACPQEPTSPFDPKRVVIVRNLDGHQDLEGPKQ